MKPGKVADEIWPDEPNKAAQKDTNARWTLKVGGKVRVLDSFLFGADHLPKHDKLELMQGDVRNATDVYKGLEGVDAVVHLAGIVGEPACAINDAASITTNIISNLTLLECMNTKYASLASRLVYMSSCSVCGNVQNMYPPVNESTPPMPLSE
jgi:nucleoside-diphosphate-sugar epimerase